MACGGSDEPKTTGLPMRTVEVEQPQADTGENRPPAIESLTLSPQGPRPGDQVKSSIRASDPDGDRVHFSYDWRINGQRAGDGPNLHTEGHPKGTLIELRVVPNDGRLEGPVETVSVRTGNQPPVMLGVVLEPLGTVSVNQDIAANPKARDPDGDDLQFRYAWTVNGDRVGGDDAVLPKEEFKRGDEIALRVVADDGSDESEPLQSDSFRVANAPPTIASVPGGFDGDGSFRYQVAASDPDGDRRLRYRLLEAPPGMAMDLLYGMLTWTPAESQAGSHPVVVEVDDMAGGKATQSFEVSVAFENSTPANQAD
jgi:hypothetical protein